MKITVITVTWNSAGTLRDTMKSVLDQTYADIEHIVVDGASTDGTMDIVREMEPLYKGRLRYVSEPDRGLYDAINKGIRMASGQVVGMLNSDDFFTAPDVLQRVAEAFGGDAKLEAVYGDIHFVNAADLTRCVRYYSSKPFRPGWMRLGFMPAHPSFYCRKSVYEEHGGYSLNYRIAADFECLLRLLFIHRINARYLPMDFVTMRTGGVSTAGWRSRWRGLKEQRRALKENGVASCLPLLMLKYIYKVARVVKTRNSKL